MNGLPRPQSIRLSGGHWPRETYSYDPAGNIKRIEVESNGDLVPKERYGYDALSRLVEAKRAGEKRTWQYDRLGNLTRTTKVGLHADDTPIGTPVATALSIDGPTNRLSDAASYYVNGNVAAGADGSAFTWDRFNQLKTSLFGSDFWTHTYDVTGERVWSWKTAPNQTTPRTDTYALRGPDGKVLRDFTKTSSGVLTWKNYIYREGQLLASREGGEGGVTKYLHLDHLGSVRRSTDENGSLVSGSEYWPYGEEVSPSADVEQMRYTGHERDLGSNAGVGDDLDYMHARYYKPIWGRFLSVDPVGGVPGRPQSWNRYSYTEGNPIGRTDPDGRSWWLKAAKAIFKGGDIAATLVTVKEDLQTLTDSSQPTTERVKAGISLASEFTPVSTHDARAAVKFISKADDVSDARRAAKVGGGASVGNLGDADVTRIQNAADRTGVTISVVGSRASGKAGPTSDWDYILSGATSSRQRHSAAGSLPSGPSLGLGQPKNQDILNVDLDESLPHITFTPRQ